MGTGTVTGNANVNHCTAYTKCLSWLERQYDKESSFLDISKVRACVCVCGEGGGGVGQYHMQQVGRQANAYHMLTQNCVD